jgi:FAD/FMN-containing dehydrogenase/Fe-S oxidoreductase
MSARFIDTSGLRGPRARHAELERRLRRDVAGEVRFDAGSRALYATDASNYRQVPIGVVVPRHIDDVVATVAACSRFDVPVLSRGGGTSLCGQCCNAAVVIDFSKRLNRIVELDPANRFARVEPGCVLDDLRDAAEKHHLTFGPDPSTHNHNTLGGMLGNNSCGIHSVMAGETVENTHELDVLTYDGERMTLGPTDDRGYAAMLARGGRAAQIHRDLRALRNRHAAQIRRAFPDIPRRVSGYNLPALLPENGFDVARAVVGSEGTCVVILGAKLRLVPSPPGRALLVIGYPSVYEAGDHVPELLRFEPIGLEGIDRRLVEDMRKARLHTEDLKLLPDGCGWLLVEFGGHDRAEACATAKRAMAKLQGCTKPPSMKLFTDAREENAIWEIRKSGLGATAHPLGKPLPWEGWEDSAVPPDKVGGYLRELRALLDKYGYTGELYGHFGQGCIHTRIDFDLESRHGIETYKRFIHEAAHTVTRLGGSISGEHGDGQSKAELLPIMFGREMMDAFREFKRIWDPRNRMNPGKVIDAYRPDQDLRLGAGYDPPRVETHFRYPQDEGDFARVALRCVGVGECRKKDGLMCPSYKVTMEERHATRGRAHLLFEMLKGAPLRQGWKSEAVREALDLCLSCKGCKSECPVHVDMATYKAEFLAHYYEGRWRGRSAYAFGLIDRWARWAARAPRLVNFLASTPPFDRVSKALAGVHPARTIPRFARRTFQQQAARRTRPRHGGKRVVLWPDTFNNHFHPATAMAALEVLEHAGFDVTVPRGHVCCGRPLYEFGMVDRARRYLERTLVILAPDLDAGASIVMLEPACASVFRDELVNLMPDDERAKRLSASTVTLAQLLESERGESLALHLEGRALVQPHCHQRSVLGTADEIALLRRLGLDVDAPDTGCCGMAGSFGFEKRKYDVSVACGERVLLPAVRSLPEDALVVADGFSCREQIAQLSGRHAMHIAEVLYDALRKGENLKK